MGGTVPYFIDLGKSQMKSDWFKFRLRTFLNIEWMTHRLCKIEITLSIQSIGKEIHGRAARRVKAYGIPVKLRILPPDVRSENGPFRPDTVGKSRLKLNVCQPVAFINFSRIKPAYINKSRLKFRINERTIQAKSKTSIVNSTRRW